MSELGFSELRGTLIGRGEECGEVERLLENARSGSSGSLVVRGEAGIGKTSLLEHAAEWSHGLLVLRATGVDAESDLAFAGLYGLVRPVLAKLGQLFEPQASALAGALGIAPSTDPDRLLVSAAVLSLLAAAAEDQPLLCLIDDAQWLDRPSADALVFTARRLRAERVAMLFAAREGDARQFPAVGLPELWVDELDERSAEAILGVGANAAAPVVRRRLLAEAAGNPLALLELPAGLTGGQLGGDEPLPDAIPLTPRLHGLFRERIAQLPAMTQTVLLIAGIDNTGELATVLRAAAGLGLAADALDPAESAALIRTDSGSITFRHPLVRSALCEAAPLGQRQRVHAALASALAGDEHADRRVWHLAMATLTGDEEVAAALEASARRAARRAGHASAATAFERAAELTLDEARLVPRLLSAASAAWDAGQPDRARGLITRAMPSAEGGERAGLLCLRGVIEARCGDMRDAAATLIEGADASDDPSLTLEMLHQAAEAAADTGARARVGAFGARAQAVPAQTRRDEFCKLVLTGFATLFAGEHARARAIFDDALNLARELDDDPQAQIWAANAASGGSDLGAGREFATRAVQLARGRGLLSLLPVALEQQGLELLANSNFEQAYAAAQEGYLLSLDLGHGWGWHLATMAGVEAVWGRERDARRHVDEVLALTERSGETFLATLARATLGLLELTIGRPDKAAEVLLEITAAERPDIHPIIAINTVPDLVEAIVRTGEPVSLLEQPLARFREWVLHAPTDARRSLLARGEALLGLRPPGDAFAEAVELGSTLAPFQRARNQLLYGEWLRRERRRTEARIHLRAASERFHVLGAAPWQERAAAELRATGETARKRDPSTLDQLTPQELQIADLVAEGLTNREIATQLFLSPRTIEYHLRKVFSKLGIASRSELIRRGRGPENAR
jgi:DNA-binding CsgD family transcriptional regulator